MLLNLKSDVQQLNIIVHISTYTTSAQACLYLSSLRRKSENAIVYLENRSFRRIPKIWKKMGILHHGYTGVLLREAYF